MQQACDMFENYGYIQNQNKLLIWLNLTVTFEKIGSEYKNSGTKKRATG